MNSFVILFHTFEVDLLLLVRFVVVLVLQRMSVVVRCAMLLKC